MWPIFADPKTDFVFKRIFGTEPNKHLLIELLNSLLELEGPYRIDEITFLTPEQKAPSASSSCPSSTSSAKTPPGTSTSSRCRSSTSRPSRSESSTVFY